MIYKIAQMQLCCVDWKETIAIGKSGNKYFVEYGRGEEGYTRTFDDLNHAIAYYSGFSAMMIRGQYAYCDRVRIFKGEELSNENS